jgi:hypothetical protein
VRLRVPPFQPENGSNFAQGFFHRILTKPLMSGIVKGVHEMPLSGMKRLKGKDL